MAEDRIGGDGVHDVVARLAGRAAINRQALLVALVETLQPLIVRGTGRDGHHASDAPPLALTPLGLLATN